MERGILQRNGWRICNSHRHIDSGQKEASQINVHQTERLTLSCLHIPMVENQLLKYSEAMSDEMNYVLAKLNSTYYVEPSTNASKNILYYQLYEEMKTLL